jgi:hypothetical protein
MSTVVSHMSIQHVNQSESLSQIIFQFVGRQMHGISKESTCADNIKL